ncbi:ribonuclease H-like domain-containing protein [Fonticella tunisiensis]|uniref:YprB ribonuclease H-like domain-containing protein n=1 Tax=Fonticella tunisiensis TaxID=1096341 RepID=A0A4R7KS96_9CLOT|nr:ribonuclease H-like domain-containing protein [Fonticella tunisiensis]TDT60962.1 hypothetical protein EDD71_11080 [Fonticella tunisiensis]
MDHIKKVYDKKICIPDNLKPHIENRKIIYFDIETTGLNPEFSKIILLGASYVENNKYIVEQFFADRLDEEELILKDFIKVLERFDMVVTYNGKNFDVPFVNKRIEKYSIGYSIMHEHLDLICHIRPNKQILGLTSCSLKSVEKYLNIRRNDTIDGGESINLYYQYLRTGDSTIKEKILLHNFEDVYNLPDIVKVFNNIEYRDYNRKITPKQRAFLSYLIRKHKYLLKRDIDLLTKEEASKLIDFILNGKDCDHEVYLEKMQ